MSSTLFFSTISSFILTYLIIPPIIRISHAKNLMDVPNERKVSKKLIPSLGGVAIFAGINISALLFMPETESPDMRILFASTIMMFFIGLKDDILVISAGKKFAIQLIAALMLVFLGDFRITQAYGIAGITTIHAWASIPLSVLVILFIINAVNLIDGIDGLAGGLTIFAASILGIWFYLAGFTIYGVLCTAMAGSLLAFLRFNLWGGAHKIFMGDTGSLVLGTILAALLIRFNELNALASDPFYFEHAPIIALSILIVPVTDTLRVFAIRIYHKKSPFSPDMNHIHHVLLKSGLTHIQASSFLIAYSGLFVMLALTIDNYMSNTLGFPLLLGASFATFGWLHYRMTAIQARQQLIIEEGKGRIIRMNAKEDEHKESRRSKKSI
ncbi:UDP-N-acetylmuramyl pentapeptide phosphotransferase/UDP-N-acetylglucosamine-1-phosphate transferase [Sunxiuqinia elliptica]|nr:UDP-N-acetylmuramyl pentapeptide phosphotransferase/UDP-N-acetylglucosamine-1-phosphate transferase [Sunxiuqinia elliptica]